MDQAADRALLLAWLKTNPALHNAQITTFGTENIQFSLLNMCLNSMTRILVSTKQHFLSVTPAHRRLTILRLFMLVKSVGRNKLLVHEFLPEGIIRGSSWSRYHSIRHDGVWREQSAALYRLSQCHSDSKHTDNTVHGAILPPHCAASWKGDTQEKLHSSLHQISPLFLGKSSSDIIFKAC